MNERWEPYLEAEYYSLMEDSLHAVERDTLVSCLLCFQW